MRDLLLAAVLCANSAGCITYPVSDERFRDVVVATRFAPGTDFGTFGTFAVAPTVDYVDVTTGSSSPVPLDDSIATPLTEAVASDLTSRGYEQVAPGEGPSLGAKIVVLKATVDDYEYAPIWGFDPFFWGYYYPYFVPVYYDYDTTLVRVDLIDTRSAVAPAGEAMDLPQLRAVWSAAVYGVLEDTIAAEADQAVQGIEQAFEQSLYLRAQ